MLFVSGNLVVKGADSVIAGGVLDRVYDGYACNLAIPCLKDKVIVRERPLEVGLRGDVIKAESLASPLGAMLLNKGFQFR